jgi:hypothetical protein
MRRVSNIFILGALFGMLLIVLPQKLNAQEGPEIIISPASVDLDMDPGESRSFKLTVINTSNIDRTFEVKLRSFNDGGEVGEPVLDDTIITPLHDWLHLPSQGLQVAASSHAEYTLNLSLPLDARPGSYRTVILFRDTQVQTDINGSIISAEFGPLLFVEVNGKVIELADILSFKAKQFVNEGLPVGFIALVSNQGNVDITPRGTVNIRPLYSLNKEQRNYDFNPTLSKTLADSQRSYSSEWVDQANWQIGYYEAEIVLAYSDSNKVLTAKTNFWILPWRAMLAVLIFTIVVMFTFRQRWKSRSKSKRTTKTTK